MPDLEEISSKRCYKCHETKPTTAFNKAKSRKDGLQPHCKACHVEIARAYRANHAEKHREYQRTYRAAHAEGRNEYSRTWCAANPDKRRDYIQANATAIREQQRAYKAAHQAANPDLYRNDWHRRRARLKGNGGSFSTQELKHMRLTQGGYCAYCQHFHGSRLTIDHIIPTTQGGRHEAGNICLACPRCNYSKQDRTPDQWLDRWYYDWRQRAPEYIPPYWYD
jgi:5-methylcytosine-specific restriction endonuclease McrA